MTNDHKVAPTEKEQTMKPQRIEGAVALVTGANRGIGRALTEALLSRGVRKVYAACLVGSEMCIRDRSRTARRASGLRAVA